MKSELAAGLVAAVTAQNTGIGTYPLTTGIGQCANAGASGTFYKAGIWSSGSENAGFGASGMPAIPYPGLDLQARSYASVSIDGTFVATINLDRSDDGGVTWRTVKSYTAPAQDTYEADISILLRLFCPTAGFTSGTANLRLKRGD